MKKQFTIPHLLKYCLLLIGLLPTLTLHAQTYAEGPDFPGVSGAPVYTLSQAGDYTFSGTVQTPNDQQDAFKVVIPTGFKITKAVLKASGGASRQQPTGFVSFADGYPNHNAASFSNDSGVDVTQSGDLGPNSADSPYIGLTSVDYSVGTTWSIKVTVVSTGGGNSCTNPDVPTVSATKTAICAGETTTLSIQSGSLNDATAWKWYSGSCGGTLVGTGSSIPVSPGSTTTYYVRGEGGCVTPGSCASLQITVNPLPTVTVTPSTTAVCTGQFATFAATPGLSSYKWSSGQTTASISVSAAGPYSVTGTNGSGCSAAATANLTVNPLPTVSITPSATAVCAGQSATFTATPGLASYRWSSGQTTATISASIAGTYSLTVTNSNSCSATTTASLTVNALPTVSIAPSAVTICAGQSTSLMASGANTYKWSTGVTTATISVSVAGPYSVTGTTTATGCSNTATASVSVTPLFNATFTGLPASVCVDGGSSTLTPTTSGGSFSGPGISGNSFNPATATVGGPYSITYTVSNQGCPNSSVQTVTVNPLPIAPMIATQSGHSYPGGVSSLTISQNVGNVILMVSGCAGGTITWAGGNSNTLAVSTFDAGVQTFTATCTNNTTGCTSPKATATVNVVGTTLSVLHRDGNGNINTNTLSPYLELQNDGNTAIPYNEITVRYWLTVENYAPLLFSINYAQLGSDKVHLKYVPATTSNPKATGYIEFSFDASAGSLAAMSNSGPIQDNINKQDYSNFDQSNDYSYAPVGNFTPNERITAYRNGVLFYGREPGPVVAMQSVKAMLQNNTGADANTIEAVLSVTNDGDLPINYGDLKVRYYFTADNNQPLVLSQVGYTALGSGNVTGQLVSLSPPLNKADTYLELSFSPGLGQLAPGASTGGVTYQIRHADYSGFNQLNDYSYQGTGGMMLNSHVVVFVAGKRAYGTEPGASARQGVEETGKLSVQVLGNPVQGSAVEVMVSGADGQSLLFNLTDLSGRSVTTRQVERAGATEAQRLEVGGASAGMLLLRVSTPTQSQTVKVLRQ